MEIEVSIGEVVDKYTILSIKKELINDDIKLQNIEKELDYLKSILKFSLLDILQDDLVHQLQTVNQQLWDVEDKLRDCERKKIFEGEFISLARSVYKLNDQRASIKRVINIKYKSTFIEEKSYTTY